MFWEKVLLHVNDPCKLKKVIRILQREQGAKVLGINNYFLSKIAVKGHFSYNEMPLKLGPATHNTGCTPYS